MSDVSIMSGLATRGAFDVLLPLAERQLGLRTRVEWNPTTVIMREIAAGARADIAVLTSVAIGELGESGTIRTDSAIDLAHAVLGLAVLRGRPKPDISSVDALRAALRAAKSVAYSRAGASGIYFESLIERLGIAEMVRARATVIPAGFTAERLVSGEADLAIQQISELKTVPGVEIVGALPDEVQVATTFTGAVFKDSSDPAVAVRLLQFLRSDDARHAYIESGLLAA